MNFRSSVLTLVPVVVAVLLTSGAWVLLDRDHRAPAPVVTLPTSCSMALATAHAGLADATQALAAAAAALGAPSAPGRPPDSPAAVASQQQRARLLSDQTQFDQLAQACVTPTHR
ncbi:MAG: hypothetical protein NVS3B12_27550 [Acidimicrobiales bacterium]